MDAISDDWKKYPLLVIGSLPAMPPGALSLAPSALGAPGAPRPADYYVLIAVSPEAAQPLLLELASAGTRAEQVLLYGAAAADYAESFGIIEALDDETAEEFRARLLQKLAGQRQRQLPAVLAEAQKGGIQGRLSGNELAAVLDVTRLAHALACAYGLAPAAHARVLRACLAARPEKEEPWASEASPESLIPGAAAMLYAALVENKPAREALRARISSLSYRARTELLHHAESCLGALTGAKHAA